MTLGDVIKDYRKTHGCSMDTFATSSGLSKAYISMLEKNENPKTKAPIKPSAETFRRAAKAMGISIGALLSMVDENRPMYVAPETPKGIVLGERIYLFKSDKKGRLSCRIDSQLYDYLVDIADFNNRTVEDEIEERLYFSMEDDFDRAEDPPPDNF
ncbi:MAG: helix-turn-helix domain-containing protein [Clostridiales bacterium]|nr:helix-turn-helix domain-containing protein [Clostridiales bacterium]